VFSFINEHTQSYVSNFLENGTEYLYEYFTNDGMNQPARKGITKHLKEIINLGIIA